jgi:DNA-binding beta-propeller fold protein YncE
MRRPSRRDLLGVLAGLPFLSDCGGGNRESRTVHTTKFRWFGKVFDFDWAKNPTGTYKGIRITVPETGEIIPFNGNVLVKDGKPYPALLGAAPLSKDNPRAAAAVSPYLCVLDVAAEDLIRLYDLNTAALLASIPVTEDPIGLDISPDGRFIYVSHLADTLPAVLPPRISVIDAVAHSVVQTINLPARMHPGVPLMSPDGSILYVPNAGQFATPGGYMGASVVLIDAAKNQMVGEISLNTAGTTIDKMAITPDGALLFAIARKFSPALLFVIDTVNREVATSTVISDAAADLLMDASGSRLYIVTDGAVFALDQHAVLVYDTASVTQLATIPITGTSTLNRLALSPDGGSLFVNPQFRPFVLRIDTTTNQIAEKISFGTDDPDSSMIFVTP